MFISILFENCKSALAISIDLCCHEVEVSISDSPFQMKLITYFVTQWAVVSKLHISCVTEVVNVIYDFLLLKDITGPCFNFTPYTEN